MFYFDFKFYMHNRLVSEEKLFFKDITYYFILEVEIQWQYECEEVCEYAYGLPLALLRT